MRAPALLCLVWASVAVALPVSRQRQKLLLVSFDGFRWDYDRDVDTPNLDQMVKDGVKAQYATPPYLTITSPTHFTLLTGLYVENHGVVHNMWFNTTTTQKLPYYQTQFKNDWWDNGSLPIWITAQRQGLKAGSLHFPGTASTYDGETALVQEVEPIMYNYKNETAWRENTDKVMSWFRDKDLDFVSMYFGEPDGTGHRYGPNSPEVKEMVKQVDRTVGYIRQTAKNYGLEDQLNIIITADHGMTTVYRNGLVEEITLSKIPGFSFKDLSFHLVDFGPSGMLLPKPGMLDKVYNALKGAHPHLHVYKKEELPERMHFIKSERILPIILWADPGYVINGYFPVQFNIGEHGYDNAEMDMKVFFRAVGPAFAQNLQVGPFETVNIYPLMCHILGIQPEKNDGNLEVTRHMLRSERRGKAVNILPNVFLGLAAVAGFLVIVFMVFTTNLILKRKKKRSQNNGQRKETEEKEDTKQTSF
ncbi:ectonucleotide pyrophosphatase/phosphodiesterase family member 7-like [Periophthalmus magnuspinnatus]|uniref:ectonucleotide pyrophosphatase/phosphodiesterase family member 7-like n=1 Tax=Periophthalmus magnuspinnatus TaxID=409849 RepID=UPI00145A8394|nr:ectonucleotide pyrophosphatase/phosphodiesterase family member 7-like [Periophthalmus magnuspinnatus]